MAQRVISTRIALDGEKEFKDQMAGVNRELRNLGSEMKLAEEKFRGQEDSVEALTEKDRILRREIEQQQEKVRALSQAVVDASEAYGKTDRKTDDFRQSLNRAQADLIRMQRELQDTEEALRDVGKEAGDAGNSMEWFGGQGKGIGNLVGSLGALKGAVAGGIAAMGLDALKDTLFELVDASEEYRKIMGTLEVSSRNAGYTAEETAETYEKLYGILGDNQTAATTTANLQAIGLAQEDLMRLINATVGAWATYGDSIPIDGLSEAINETIRAGQVTGVFADVLNWGAEENERYGVTMRESTEANKEWNTAVENATSAEDFFNLALQECQTEAERVDLILKTMANQGLNEAGRAWQAVNQDIINANTAQSNWQAQMARLGEMLSPAKDALINFGAEALGFVIDKIEAAIGFVTDLINAFKNIPRNNLMIKVPEPVENDLAHRRYAIGLERVPYDDYHALLHKDEMVLTAAESDALRTLRIGAPQSGGVTAKDLQEVTAAAVNAMALTGTAGGNYTIHLQMNVNGREFYTETIEDFRAVARANPEVSSDR